MYCIGLKYEYKAVNLLKGEQFSPGQSLPCHFRVLYSGELNL